MNHKQLTKLSWYRVCTVQHWIIDRHAYSMQTRRIRRLHFHCTRGNATGICALYRNVLRFQRLKQPSTLRNWTARALKASGFSAPQKAQWYNIGQSWQSLPHSLRLSAEKCKPNARSSWSSSPGQNGRSHQNNALALQIKHPFYSLLIVSHFYRQNTCSFWFFLCLRLAHESCRPCNWWSRS